MTQRLLVINAVGLTQSLLGEHSPNLNRLARQGSSGTIEPVMPAVTCSVQASYLTGLPPSGHGVVGNGWYHEALSEIRFWHQSNRLVAGEKLWQTMKERDPDATCANLFWWFNMYSDVDHSVTVRPIYCADGRKIPDIYTHPANWRDQLSQQLGQFPLFHFWGPKSDIRSSRWIVDATLATLDRFNPTLTLVYLPHLDYGLQQWGPEDPRVPGAVAELDQEIGRLLQRAEADDIKVVVLSEYGIQPVEQPVHINRVLRRAGWLKVREELGLELLDPGASQAFAVADHQIAHVYLDDDIDKSAVVDLLMATPGVAEVWQGSELALKGLAHERAGDLVVLAEQGAWFTYYYWLDDARAPDFARTVEIHKKPGYDPAELFVDPKLSMPWVKIAWILLKKKLGFRTLMDVIPLDANLVKGSHGRPPVRAEDGACFISSEPVPERVLSPMAVKEFLLERMALSVQSSVPRSGDIG